ncbi:hypothetical protein RvY_02289 [Ramazzottius varieornatus]|uniref:Uncharacterized protein n=1 Tax=Ramazzottius varieornatus TaxID=947166 RepID=A0A1D1UUC6_RAMVA|nr:hypothetical protein RvY_02289 [Ramazzottius varieornatus]
MDLKSRNSSYCWSTNTTALDAAGFRKQCPQYTAYYRKNYVACFVGMLYEDGTTRSKVTDPGIGPLHLETHPAPVIDISPLFPDDYTTTTPTTPTASTTTTTTTTTTTRTTTTTPTTKPSTAERACSAAEELSSDKEICTLLCNNPYYCAKEDKTKPWPCGNPYGCAPWQCEVSTWLCMPPKDVVNVWNCGHPTNCKPPQPNPWNCTSPWNCSIPQQVKDEFSCTNPWDCKPSKNKLPNCNTPFDCRPPDAVIDCLKTPKLSCANTIGNMRDIPAWLFTLMATNMQRLVLQVPLPANIQQN